MIVSPIISKGNASVPAGRHSTASRSWSSPSATSRSRSFSMHLLSFQTPPGARKYGPSTFQILGGGISTSFLSLDFLFLDLLATAFFPILTFTQGLRRGVEMGWVENRRWKSINFGGGGPKTADVAAAAVLGFVLCRCK